MVKSYGSRKRDAYSTIVGYLYFMQFLWRFCSLQAASETLRNSILTAFALITQKNSVALREVINRTDMLCLFVGAAPRVCPGR